MKGSYWLSDQEKGYLDTFYADLNFAFNSVFFCIGNVVKINLHEF